MGFRERMEDREFAFEFSSEDGVLLFTSYGKNEDNDNCYLVTAPIYENPANLAMYYIATMDDVLRFMADVYEISEADLDAAIASAEEVIVFETGMYADEEEEGEVFVPGQMDETAEFGDNDY